MELVNIDVHNGAFSGLHRVLCLDNYLSGVEFELVRCSTSASLEA